ncbi:MAG: DUF192 domain-containing protein [Candidatus Nanohaloarchaeota archaeon QJJ-7]|nr:DUF192 domain-containing protein [Candidatus Nanohaloarchaeota archaeon QJJ-7]
MRVFNRDTGSVIPEVRRMESQFQKFLGLRFREGRALFSFDRPTRAPLDMVFVPQPLDIAFLDEDMEVMEVHGAHPVTINPETWKFYSSEEPYSHVLEVEAGLLPHLGFDIGHSLELMD